MRQRVSVKQFDSNNGKNVKENCHQGRDEKELPAMHNSSQLFVVKIKNGWKNSPKSLDHGFPNETNFMDSSHNVK